MKSTGKTGKESSVIEALANEAKEEREAELKKRQHLWKPGQSGNPAGRPLGAKNKHTLLKEAVKMQAEEMVLRKFKQIVDVTIEKAQEGDSTCLKILWDRFVPNVEKEEKSKGAGKVVINIGRLTSIEDADIEEVSGEILEHQEDVD